MKCLRCGQEFKPPQDGRNYIVCGNCGDDLREEDNAVVMALDIEAEETTMFQMNKEAYEEAHQRGESDYRHI